MAIPILNNWQNYFTNHHEGLGSSYERIIINNLLLNIKDRYNIESVLEVPIFGFTGLTGLNSIILSKNKCLVTLVEKNETRIKLVRELLKSIDDTIVVKNTNQYTDLSFEDKSFDMIWNFSALWFVEDLASFLREISRLANKCILIFVPNQDGLGFKWQKSSTAILPQIEYHPSYINPEIIIKGMNMLKWNLSSKGFIDCPPWPDIGMSKELFVKALFNRQKKSQGTHKPKEIISIIDYYKGSDPNFEKRMSKYSFLEKYAPNVFKRIWCHHKWMLFVRDSV